VSPFRRIAHALVHRSPSDLLDRATQLLRARLEAVGIGDSRAVSGDGLLRILSQRGVEGADDLLRRFQLRVERESLPAFRDPELTLHQLRDRWPDHAGHVETRAARIAEGRFDLLGFEGLDFGDPIDWSLDPVNQRTSPSVHWSRVPYLDPDTVGDHKIVWELNRHQYFVRLGQAFWLTEDPRWAETFVEHVDRWMAANPPKMGINWTSSLEIAFRAMSWLWALHFFARAPQLTSERFAAMVAHLRAHGRHIEQYVSTSFSPNTHLTGEALGLFYLGTLLPELPEAARWRQKGRAWLMDALEFQIRPDGGYFEQSIHYHRYTADFYIHLLHLSRTFGLETPSDLEERLGSVVDHLVSVTKADGTAPLIGDDDGGKLLFLDGRPPYDVRSTLAAAAVLLDRADWAACAGPPSEDLVWLLGPKALDDWEDLGGGPAVRESRSHPDTGFHVMRSGPADAEDFLLVRCGPPAALSGGHSHADALGLDLTLGGRSLLIDPGTASYSNREQREWFRSTAAHNTITMGGESSSQAGGPFGWSHRPTGLLDAWVSLPPLDFFAGQHDGFDRLGSGVRHERSILYVRDEYWVVRDRVHLPSDFAMPSDLGVVRAHFQFPPELSVTRSDPNTLRVDGPGGDAFATIVSLGRSEWVEVEGRFSPVYGRVLPAPAWTSTYDTPEQGRVELVTLIARPGVHATRLSQGGDSLWQIGEKGDLLSLGPQSPDSDRVSFPHLDTDFEWVWARPASGGGFETLLAVEGSRLSLGSGASWNHPSSVAHLCITSAAGTDPSVWLEPQGSTATRQSLDALRAWYNAL